ncbi:large subunit of alpha-aminoadipate reductase [Polyrhizophydium stewartii]|uniref:Large subunit of alpha-aminoadipate reductase n=1 Tax=Polyrhizophydium stewartii TaxID=2732419 RepID=A0ABR4N1F8_9FUNG
MSHSARLDIGDNVTIGRPIPNCSSHILDTSCRSVPVGVVGEMCIGGIGVSRGYINLPDLTAQRFVPDPFSPEPGARMFRTGDLGRLLPDGNFEILGRMDDQVKLKGYRIELDEVAAAMMRHPRVSAAAAVVKDKTHLVGFVVPADVDHDELRDVVAAALPAYMVPAVFVGLAVMPTNTNGKTDKKALAAMHVEIAVDALQTDTERALAAVWSQVLGVQVADIGRATSFFALGGDSISATRMVSALSAAGLHISTVQLLNGATISRIATQIDAASQSASDLEPGHQTAYADDLDHVDEPSIAAESLPPFDFAKLLPSASPTFFLTGATGFLGAFVLQSLLERLPRASVVCLVRAESDSDAAARLISTSKKHLAWSETWLRDGRVRAVAGDLSEEHFGLSDAAWDALCHEVDVIIHNGALVHWFYPYSEMRGPNVIGTRTGLQLATTHHLKPFHFVSTGSTLAPGDTQESTDLEMSRTSLVGGYAQSKWVAEKLVMRARSRGVPATIFRPNRITGDSRHGVCNTDDFVWRLVKGAAQLGKIPRDPRVVNMSAVDHVAACLVEIALSPRSIELGAFHMCDHQGYTFDELLGSLEANGFAVERVAHGDWRNTLEATVLSEADNALFPVLPFVLSDDPDASVGAHESMLDDTNMQAIIAEARVPVIAPDHSRITPLSLGYMVAVGFLGAPHDADVLPYLDEWSGVEGGAVARTGRSGATTARSKEDDGEAQKVRDAAQQGSPETSQKELVATSPRQSRRDSIRVLSQLSQLFNCFRQH